MRVCSVRQTNRNIGSADIKFIFPSVFIIQLKGGVFFKDVAYWLY